MGEYPPSPDQLISFAFLSRSPRGANYYQLTEKAFDLNRIKPATMVFISYRGSESSAFALLIKACLELAGVKDVFIDKNMVGGSKWKNDLEENVKECKYFVCLIGPTTLESQNVQNEIKWATEYEKTIIPICHNGYSLKEAGRALSSLENSNGREIKANLLDVTAREYDEIVQFIVNSVTMEKD